MKAGNQQGFTLIELLVAMVVALLTVAAMLGVFATSQRTYRVQERITDTQQNARVGLELLVRDVRMAGYGLPRLSGTPTVFAYGTFTANGTTYAANNSTEASQLKGTDAIALNRASGPALAVRKYSKGVGGGASNIFLQAFNEDPVVQVGQIISCVTSDGNDFATFQVTQVQRVKASACNGEDPGCDKANFSPGLSNLNSPGGLDADYTGGLCYVFERRVYFVDPSYRLMVSVNDQAPVVVATGVEDLQIAFRLKDGTWLHDPTAANEPDIRLVRLNVLARTAREDPRFQSSPQGVVGAASLEDHALSSVNDGYYRRLMTSLVKVRNNESWD